MKDRANCSHLSVSFGSGDYYIFCDDCHARWVACSPSNDQPSPELANQNSDAQYNVGGQKRRYTP